MRDQDETNTGKHWRTSAPPSAIEHFSSELKRLRTPSPAVIAQVIRDALFAHAEAEQAAAERIAEAKASLAQDFYAFLELHTDTAASDKLSAKKTRLLDTALEDIQEFSDEQN
ncbi:hypothetical protein [Chromatocurvus halotolerans]|uniref:Uncharacterized protein n=1 Tax=Chromatocurvus halotolerans TaxID=1132028 RepID=A0A4R2KSQ1_9GAMM|nr:hypothetical protein [Chromatocurvus halotolerans]TCO75822.1 hypothetical protein EV688_10611 [Chromatocurvus halotolerans]